ncbi:hypothetical protein Vafri_936 [Volvox africanus]|nr:hypothetical protein Vafri_936 [Volvox africanus]
MMPMTRIVRCLPRAVTPRFRTAYHFMGTHPSGSKALDVLTGGGYPSGSIIEIQGSDLKPCWQLAWLAAAAAYKRGWKVTACSGAACLDFGAERGLTARDKFARTSVAQPQALLDVVRWVERDCSLIMVDSWARIAEAAEAPAGPDSSAIRAMRNRRLAGFLRQLSSRLLLHKAQEGSSDNDNGCFNGARSQDYALRNWPAPSVIVCSTGQKGHGSVLQQYAAMRLRVSERREDEAAEDGPGHMVVEMLKGPAVNTRMPITQTRVYLSSRTTNVVPFTDVQDPRAALDLLVAAQALGFVGQIPCNESSPKISMSAAEQTAEQDVYDNIQGFPCGVAQGESTGVLASKLVETGHMMLVRKQVDEKLQQLSTQNPRLSAIWRA